MQTLLEVHPNDLVKVAYDYDDKHPTEAEGRTKLAELKVEVNKGLDELTRRTGHRQFLTEVATHSDCRRFPDGGWKTSYHVFFPAFVITASHMNAFYDACKLSDKVDRVPFNMGPAGRRLWRSVGASKKGSKSFFKPISLANSDAHHHCFHEHLLTFTTGNEINITELFPNTDSRPSRRQRTETPTVPFVKRAVQQRPLVRAPFLNQFTDGQLDRMASAELERLHIDCDHGNSKVQGNRIYYEAGLNGRKCKQGRTHQHNRFYVEFKREGDMRMHCFSDACAKEGPLGLGQWQTDLHQLLDSDCRAPGKEVNPRLLTNLRELAIEATTMGRTRVSKLMQMPDMPWSRKLEETVGRYLSHYFKFIVRESLYIMQTLNHEGDMETFQAFQIADVVRGYKWAFTIWEESDYKLEYATCARFCGEPFDADVEEGDYNLSKNAMPYLNVPYEEPTSSEIEQLQPILDHIRSSLCADNHEDYEVFMAWIAHVAKWPNKKIGWYVQSFAWLFFEPTQRFCKPFKFIQKRCLAGCLCSSETRGRERESYWGTSS